MIGFRNGVNQHDHYNDRRELYMMPDFAQQVSKPERRDKSDDQNDQQIQEKIAHRVYSDLFVQHDEIKEQNPENIRKAAFISNEFAVSRR